MTTVEITRVIPESGRSPARIYEHDGEGVIVVYAIAENPPWPKPPVQGGELFRMTLPKDQAQALMNDLYYGEYTGA